MKAVYICQLPKAEKLEIYKRIKAILIESGALTPENIRIALDSKITDIEA